MITENLSTLKIHKLTKEQYERELAAGRIDENALYLTPDEAVDLSQYVTNDDLEAKGYLTNFTESDPTVPNWAKQPNKPTYTASEVGALPVDTIIPSIEGLATETYVNTQIASLVNSAPEALNTLDELAAALGDDSNFATTVTNQIAAKQDAITGTAGQFVVIGDNGKPTTKTIPYAEEATF